MPKPIRVFDPDGSPKSEPQSGGLNESHRDLETVPKRRRRVFSAADKLRIVKEADRCLASGERGALVCARQLVDVGARRVADGLDGGVREARGVMAIRTRAFPAPKRARSALVVVAAFEKRAA